MENRLILGIGKDEKIMLTLQEIENISFRESRFSMRSYSCEDVDKFVDDVTETVKDYESKISELKARIAALEAQIQTHEEKADSVQDAIITAEVTAKSLIKKASSKAEKIMSEAAVKSEKIVAESKKTAQDNIYTSAEKARMILDNALSGSAQCVAENNRILEDQKVYITMLQDEVTQFRESLLDMYKKHLEMINSLPEKQKCREYQESLDENYPTEEPVTADAVVDKLKEEAEKTVVPKRDEREITVEMSKGKTSRAEGKEETAVPHDGEEIVFNSSGASQKFADIKNENIKINFVNTNDTSEKK